MKTLFAIVAVLALSGCAAEMVDQNPTYAAARSQEITTPAGTYIVKDNPAAGKALVRPSVGTAFGENAIVPHSKEAVKAMLRKAGRNCQLHEGYAVGDFFEVVYSCK